MDVAELGIKHLCEDTLGYKVESAKSAEGEFYGSSLPIFKGKEEFHFYLYFKKDTLNRFAGVLLGVDKLAERYLQRGGKSHDRLRQKSTQRTRIKRL